jgi:WXXGXW repeat (2 copies)
VSFRNLIDCGWLHINRTTMMKLRSFILAGFVFVALPLMSFAQVGISVNFAPPPLPVVVQPPVPMEGYIWTPGYWAWGGADYYWVPGVWVPPPTIGLLWTPPWWGWNNGVYVFNEGYWGPTVGFYGGINYGFGYFGDGYWGGRWEGNTFRYNTAVTRVNTNVIHNTFVDKSVVNKQANASHASFNGPNGVKAQPTAEQKAAAEKKVPPTSEQLARREAASKDKNLQASVNKGHPKPEAIKSFNQTQAQGKGAQGIGAAATGAGAGKNENKPANLAEHAGLGAGAGNAGQHGNKHTAENVHGQQNLAGTHDKAHTGKPLGYAGPAHGPHATNQQMAHHPPMGAYHPQAGGPNRGHAAGPQQQGKKKQPGPPHG